MSSLWALSGTVRALIIMSATGSATALLLFAIKPLIKNHLPKAAQYYLWVLVLAAFLVPFSSFVSLPFSTPLAPLQETLDKTAARQREALTAGQYVMEPGAPDAQGQIDSSLSESGAKNGGLRDYIMCALIIVGGAVFLIDFLQYTVYVSKLRGKRLSAGSDETALLRSLCGDGRRPCLYRSNIITTPMLVGVFRPAIYLPDREYSEWQLKNIMLHELTHMRRQDVAIKWIAAVAVYVHWFNPISYLVRREIDRACELACDEAVINGLDSAGKQSYGDTLIAMASKAKSPRFMASTTMCEEKKTLKERLEAIMKSKRINKRAIAFSGAFLDNCDLRHHYSRLSGQLRFRRRRRRRGCTGCQ